MSVSDPTLRAFVFRATHPDYRDLHHTVAMSRQYPMRFNTATVGAVYVCEDPQTAVEELRRRAKLARRRLASFTPRSMLVLEVVLHRILDLVEPGLRDDWGLSEEDLESDEYGPCQGVAAAAAAAGFEAIRWPSATASGISLAVFFDRLVPGSGMRVRADCDLDLEMLDRRVPVLELVPDLRRWLPSR